MASRLFTTAYHEPHDKRRAELKSCLRLNLQAFDEVIVLAQNLARPEWFKGRWFEGTRRQHYSDLLAMASGTQPDDVVVLANSDIEIPHATLARLDAVLAADEVFALSRWDVDRYGNRRLFDLACSQDVWAFRGPPREHIGGRYPFGVPGVDNRFAHELQAAGYDVLNPARDIQTLHHHLSGHRPHNLAQNRVPGPYLFVRPHRLGEMPEYARPAKVSRRASQF